MRGWLREADTCTPALIAFTLGAALLLFFPSSLPTSTSSRGNSWSRLGDLSRCVDEPVHLTGTVLNISQYETVTKIELLPSLYPVEVVVFPHGKLDLAAGDVIRAEGRVQLYKGRSELVADSIEVR